jgi:hypothetical protein
MEVAGAGTEKLSKGSTMGMEAWPALLPVKTVER